MKVFLYVIVCIGLFTEMNLCFENIFQMCFAVSVKYFILAYNVVASIYFFLLFFDFSYEDVWASWIQQLLEYQRQY